MSKSENQEKPKKEKEIIEYNGIVFDSLDEMYFYWWCEEAKENGLLVDFKFHPQPFVLSEPMRFDRYEEGKVKSFKKIGTITLGRKIVYQSDFLLIFTQLALDKKLLGMVEPTENFGKIYCGKKSDYHFLGHERTGFPYAINDVKPAIKQAYNGISSKRDFGIKRAFLLKEHGLYVNETVVINQQNPGDCLFSVTFAPKKYLYRPRLDGKGYYKIYCEEKTIEDYMK